MTNVYRVAVILKEEIQQELLQQALDMVLPKFSVFNCRLRQGMFWYYFEENGKNHRRYMRSIRIRAVILMSTATGVICFG